jgi:hypothetical protein
VQQSIKPQEYKVFVDCIMGNPAARRLAASRAARVDTLLQDSIPAQGAVQRKALPGIQCSAVRAWADMEGLVWDKELLLGLGRDSFLGRITCKHFRRDGVSSFFFGIVVAQTHPEEEKALFRIIYKDGDMEDSSQAEVEEAVDCYSSIQEELDEEDAEAVASLPDLAEGWRKQASAQQDLQRADLRASLAGITFAVILPKKDQRDLGWSSFCYKYARKRPNKDQWMAAEDKELNTLWKMEAFDGW